MNLPLTTGEERQRRREQIESAVRRGAALLWPEREAEAIVRIAPWDTAGKWQVLHATVRFSSGETDRLTLTAGPSDRILTMYARHYGAPADAGQAEFLEPEGFVVERFPADWKLRGLQHVTRSEIMATLLSDAGLLSPGESEVDIDSQRYLPHKRAVLRYTAGSTPLAIGKLYSSGSRSERAYGVLKYLQEQSSAHLFPLPHLLRREWSFVLMEWLPGVELQILLDQEPEAPSTLQAVQATARSLAELHRIPGDGTPHRRWQVEAEALLEHAEVRSAPIFQDAVRMLKWCLERPQADEGRLVFTHGDFNPRQVLWHQGTAFIVDMDRGGSGLPAWDVGRFTAALKGKAIRETGDVYRRLAAAFEAEYEAVSGQAIVAAAAIPEAVAILHRALRLQAAAHPEMSASAQKLVAEAESSLISAGYRA